MRFITWKISAAILLLGFLPAGCSRSPSDVLGAGSNLSSSAFNPKDPLAGLQAPAPALNLNQSQSDLRPGNLSLSQQTPTADYSQTLGNSGNSGSTFPTQLGQLPALKNFLTNLIPVYSPRQLKLVGVYNVLASLEADDNGAVRGYASGRLGCRALGHGWAATTVYTLAGDNRRIDYGERNGEPQQAGEYRHAAACIATLSSEGIISPVRSFGPFLVPPQETGDDVCASRGTACVETALSSGGGVGSCNRQMQSTGQAYAYCAQTTDQTQPLHCTTRTACLANEVCVSGGIAGEGEKSGRYCSSDVGENGHRQCCVAGNG